MTGLATAWSIWWLTNLPVRATLQKDLAVEQQVLDRANDAAFRLPSLLATLRNADAETSAWRRLLPVAGRGDTSDSLTPMPTATATSTPIPTATSTATSTVSSTATSTATSIPDEDGDGAATDAFDDWGAPWRADLEGSVARAGLMLESARPGPSASVGEIEVERAEMRVQGTVANMLGWLAEIDGMPRLLIIEHFSLEGPGIRSSNASTASDAPATLTVMIAAYAWRRPADLPMRPPTQPLPTLPERTSHWQLPAETIDVFQTPLTRRSAQDAVTMAVPGRQVSGDDDKPVGAMRAGARRVVLRRTSGSGFAVTWSHVPPLARAGAHGDDTPSVDLTLHGVPAVDALRAFARLTGRSVVIGERVAGLLDMEVRGVSAATAFDVMIRSAGLGVQSIGGVDWIAPRADLLADEQSRLEAAAKREAMLPLASRRFMLNYPRAVALREIIMGGKDSKGQRLLSARGSLIADPRTNQLFVTDLPERLDALASFISRVDVPVRQVLIEARIVEANDRFSESLGVRLAGVSGGDAQIDGSRSATHGEVGEARGGGTDGGGGKPPGSTVDIGLPAAALAGVAPPSLAITLFGRSAARFLQLELSALETRGQGRVVSRPRVVTADKVPAVIEQGTELPYQTRSGSRNTLSLHFRKATLKLEVTPLITPDGQVILDVDVRKDSVGQEVAGGFAVDTRHVKTQVQVEDGGTVAIGGIYQEETRDSRAGVPWLGDVPVLGALFRNRANEDRRTELLVFLTPSVVPEGASGHGGGGLAPAASSAGAALEMPADAPAVLPAPVRGDSPAGHPRLTGTFLEVTRSARPTHIPVLSGVGTQISAIYAGKRNTRRTDGGGQDHGRTRSCAASGAAVL
ncbi:type IV pilus secretin PilQ [Pandoraea pnomenusa]|uniref:type IV pilus secretin PilQ n=1 Tax=Pandoraea pnomenusa TaxID=93220 RepID=UPI0033406010